MALLIVAVFALVAWPGVPAGVDFTAVSFHRIRVGMSRAEVEAILGPPRNCRTVAVDDAEGWELVGGPLGGGELKLDHLLFWTGNSGEVRIYFSHSDKVAEASFQPQTPSASLWKRVRWRFWRSFPSAAPVGAS